MVQFPVPFVKESTNIYTVCTDFPVINNKLIKINKVFLFVRDCMQIIGQSQSHILSIADL